MPSLVTHSITGIATAQAFAGRETPIRFWIFAVICAVFPDADVIGYYLRVPYSHFFGHRGFFHSPFFSMLLSLVIVSLWFREEKVFSKSWCRHLVCFFLAGACHGILDAFTNGGLGIALLSPFDNTRYFFPWTPIQVSPLSVRAFFSEWGIRVITSEMVWVWMPLFCFALLVRRIRRRARAYVVLD